MKQYIELTFQNVTPAQSDLLLAKLSEIGFEGFEEEHNLLKAFIPSADFDLAAVNSISAELQTPFSQSVIAATNWNEVWESNFQPVVVDDFAAIRADFHSPITGVEHEIVITPKMSFGTGHHATTFMMMQQMRDINFNGKTVFDFGTGTGILAILAEKLGAANIIAVDNDDWSIDNTADNIQRNSSHLIVLQKAEVVLTDKNYDVILANINKNVILAHFNTLVAQLNPEGVLLLSGLLVEDKEDILKEAAKYSLQLGKITEKNNWISLRFSH